MGRFIRFVVTWFGLVSLAACAGGGMPFPFADKPEQPLPAPTAATLRIAAPVGAPESHAAALMRRMQARATERSITIVGTEGSAAFELKGYFSTITEGGATTVLYVWDVLDSTATRLHRIQGQAPSPQSGGDGWKAVPGSVMEEIGTRSMDGFADWLAARD